MKKSTTSQTRFIEIFLLVSFFCTFWLQGKSSNPQVSNYFKNISATVNSANEDDEKPEIIISGNIIHLVWHEVKSNGGNIYYCKSPDLGKTWGTPIVVSSFKDGRDHNRNPQTRKLAIDGNNVHIAWCDMVNSSNWASKIYYARSTNGGNSFEQVKELTSKGGDGSFAGCHIKAVNGKVAIAFKGTPNAKNGLFMLFSSNNGSTFTEKLITTEPTGLSDFYYDGNQMIVLSEYVYYYYGLSEGRVYVSISNDNAANFTTQKISITYNESATVVRERCRSTHDVHYSSKIAKSGNNIHVVFCGYNEKVAWTTLYARSTDNGSTFQKAIDINNGVLHENNLQSYQESVVAKNGHVYIGYLSKSGKVFFHQSSDNGNTFSGGKDIMPVGITHVEGVWFPSLVLDPNDATGNVVYLTGSNLYSAKSVDGGKTFTGNSVNLPILYPTFSHSVADLAIDASGGKHWIAEAKMFGGSDVDIFYRSITAQPNAGTTNKALSITAIRGGKQETVIVPPSPSINFQSAMTGEAWVKILPGGENELNVFGKVNGYDGPSYQPSGYQLTFHNYVGKRYLNAGIQTDKGQFINWTGAIVGDTLWHHIAFTYDEQGGLKNFKTYFNGLLVAEQTVTGKIISGEGLFMIGSRYNFVGTNYCLVDEIRLWNRALTQDELLSNQTKKLTGNEAGLKLYLNFDDTYKDISGNGNDAIPLHLGILKKSNFNPPATAFDLYQSMNSVSLTNKTQNGKTYQWSFGDNQVSDKGNPVYQYPKAGEYTISLEASNDNSVTTALKKVTIAGLDRIEPVQAGNGGYATLSVFGGGLVAEGTTFLLRKTGEQDILGEKLASPGKGILAAYFNLNGKTQGKWDVVVKKSGAEQVLKEAFTIVKAELPDPWVSISGRGAVLFNMWQTYTVNYGNNGNVDALGVPVLIAITNHPTIDVELIDFFIEPSPNFKTKYPTIVQARQKNYFVWDDYFGKDLDARVYAFVIPVVKAKSAENIHIRIKSPAKFDIESWTGKPFFQTAQTSTKSASVTTDDWPDEKTKLNACVAAAAMDAASNVAADLVGAVLPIDCAYDVITSFWNPWEAISPLDKKKGFWDYTSGFSGAFLSCAAELSGAELLIKGGLMIKDIYEGYEKNKECHEAFDPKYKNRMGVNTVSSFDPNEMIGPAGFGDKHWIQKTNALPYTILFENKSTATAPAHIVTITDQLDLQKFDLSEFGFGSFGFGDTTLVPNGKKLKQFSMDIDMKPTKNLIARVSGNLDTITGVVKWEFLSLNPTTMQLEEDPMLGFLPPNNINHAGEGFVSFSVGLKKDAKTNDILRNKASIVFDANVPIITNEFVNMLDLDKPQSQVYPLDATIDSRFPLAWTGSDNGSGIATYSIFVMENDTALRPWKINTTLKTAEFIGNVGSKYKFYSIASDNVSLKEDSPSQYDASTHITVHVDEFEMKKEQMQIFPNPATEQIRITLPNAPCGIYAVELVNIAGQTVYSELHDDVSISNGLTLSLSGLNRGQYLVRMIYGHKVVTQKLMIE